MAEKQLTSWRSVLKRKGNDPSLLYSEDLGPVGTVVDVEIVDSGVMTKDDGEGRKKDMPWLAFRGGDGKPRKKRLGLGATMCKSMKAITGSIYIEEWRGWITLLVVETEYRDSTTGTKERTDAIRIAPKRPNRQSSDARKDEPSAADRATPSVTDSPRGYQGESSLSDDEKREIAELERKGAQP